MSISVRYILTINYLYYAHIAMLTSGQFALIIHRHYTVELTKPFVSCFLVSNIRSIIVSYVTIIFINSATYKGHRHSRAYNGTDKVNARVRARVRRPTRTTDAVVTYAGLRNTTNRIIRRLAAESRSPRIRNGTVRRR